MKFEKFVFLHEEIARKVHDEKVFSYQKKHFSSCNVFDISLNKKVFRKNFFVLRDRNKSARRKHFLLSREILFVMHCF